MVRSLRERKQVNYNVEAMETDAAYEAAADNSGDILAFAQAGINNAATRNEAAPSSDERPARNHTRGGRSKRVQDSEDEEGSSADEVAARVAKRAGGRRSGREGRAKASYRELSEGEEEEEASEASSEESEDAEASQRDASSDGEVADEIEDSDDDFQRPASKSRGSGDSTRRPPRAGRAKAAVVVSSDAEEEAKEEEDGDFAPAGRRTRPRKAGARDAAAAATRQQPRRGGRPAYVETGSTDLEDEVEDDEQEEGSFKGTATVEEAGSGSEGEEEKSKGNGAPAGRASRRTPRSLGKQPSAKAKQPATKAAAGEGAASRGGAKKSGKGAKKRKQVWEEYAVEKILDARQPEDGGEQELYCKFKELSYRKCEWVPEAYLWEERSQLLRNFLQRRADDDDAPSYYVNGVDPTWLTAERVIAEHKGVEGGRCFTEFLVKWNGLGYAEATWEREEDMQDDKEFIDRFRAFNKAPSRIKTVEASADALPSFNNGRQLRDYQQVSLRWMIGNWNERRNCILGDEMGLGKTAQSISVLEFQRQLCGYRGPYMVLAPLTTLGHWKREIETWTDMNVVVYSGGQADRDIIRENEFRFPNDKPGSTHRAKFNVLLISYEMLSKDLNKLKDYKWETVIIDEAHRMKSTNSQCRGAVQSLNIEWLLLLTGTPIQNNMRELYGIMSLLDPEKWDDEDEFLERFGGRPGGEAPTLEQVQELQGELQPILLRRMKEDVETLPEKEEIVVRVELTSEQRVYYKALYSRQVGALLGGASSKNMPNLRNLAMELRKLCCHPYLCNGLEDDISDRRRRLGAGASSKLDLLVSASGKMVMLHKLLPMLREKGKKVLIFSQFKIMLDVLEDYMQMMDWPVERIDGSVGQQQRQAAIDRYSKGEVDGFVFLLSTKAGGQGITLTAADTVVLYDSDWNPQNDLQAIARAHRIGQQQDVTIYRLVSNNTYEEELLKVANLKQGLDAAILGSMGSDSSGSGNPEDDSKRIAQLLKHGAHILQADEDAANAATDAFVSEDIEQILSKRTSKRTLGGKAGNMFSQISFDANKSMTVGKASEREYWTTLMPDAVKEYDAQAAASAQPEVLAPRARRPVNYNEDKLLKKLQEDDGDDAGDGEDAGDDSDYGSGDDASGKQGRRPRARPPSNGADKDQGPRQWTKVELKSLEDKLVTLGPTRPQVLKQQAMLGEKPDAEVGAVVDALLRVIDHFAARAAKDAAKDSAAAGGAGPAAGLALERVASVDDPSGAGSSGRQSGLGSDPALARAGSAASIGGPETLLQRKGSNTSLPDNGKTAAAAAAAGGSGGATSLPEGVAIPEFARRAFSARETVQRLSKGASKYAACLQEVQALAGLVQGPQGAAPAAVAAINSLPPAPGFDAKADGDKEEGGQRKEGGGAQEVGNVQEDGSASEEAAAAGGGEGKDQTAPTATAEDGGDKAAGQVGKPGEQAEEEGPEEKVAFEYKFVAPGIAPKGDQVRGWWKAKEHNAALLRGLHTHGYLPWNMKKPVEAILMDTSLGFPVFKVDTVDGEEEGGGAAALTEKEEAEGAAGCGALEQQGVGKRPRQQQQQGASPAAVGKEECEGGPETKQQHQPKHGSEGEEEEEHADDGAAPKRRKSEGGVAEPVGEQQQEQGATAPDATAGDDDVSGGPTPIRLHEGQWRQLVAEVCKHAKNLMRYVVDPLLEYKERYKAERQDRHRRQRFNSKKSRAIIGAELLKGARGGTSAGFAAKSNAAAAQRQQRPDGDRRGSTGNGDGNNSGANNSGGDEGDRSGDSSPAHSLSPACAQIAAPGTAVRPGVGGHEPKSSVKPSLDKRPRALQQADVAGASGGGGGAGLKKKSRLSKEGLASKATPAAPRADGPEGVASSLANRAKALTATAEGASPLAKPLFKMPNKRESTALPTGGQGGAVGDEDDDDFQVQAPPKPRLPAQANGNDVLMSAVKRNAGATAAAGRVSGGKENGAAAAASGGKAKGGVSSSQQRKQVLGESVAGNKSGGGDRKGGGASGSAGKKGMKQAKLSGFFKPKPSPLPTAAAAGNAERETVMEAAA